MNISFCITTNLHNVNFIDNSIQSIERLNLQNYEILVISEKRRDFDSNVNFIFFNENESKRWITKKKNILASNSKYENIVMMHDYFIFYPDWYDNFLEFGEDWDVCSNSQLLLDGRRHCLDWTVWDDPIYERYTGMCYDDWSRTQYMYVSGAFYLVKRDFAIQNPLNEDLNWGQAEDVDWSLRIRNKAKIKCNGKSIVRHCKAHRDLGNHGFKTQKCNDEEKQ